MARWCLDTAVAYAKVREQFGSPIGSFQAIKHLCAEMLCRSESAAAVAWDAAEATPAERPLAAAVAASVALDAAVTTAQDCIQVLGGIGFTWEHDAHLYLRRALALRAFVGGTARWRRRVAELRRTGARRTLHIDLGEYEAAATARARPGRVDRGGARRPAACRAWPMPGLLAPHWPAPHGLDAGPAEQVLIDQELARAGVTRPDLVIAGWAIPTIIAHGTAEQIERFAAPTLRGELTWCQLFSEPGAGSDLASLRTRAVRVDGGWALSGQKVWTSLAHRADWAICLARTNPDVPKHKGITYFLVDMRSAGIDIRPLREITGEAMFNEVFLDDVFVPDDLVVGEVDGGWPLARDDAGQRTRRDGQRVEPGRRRRRSAGRDRDGGRREWAGGARRRRRRGPGVLAARSARDDPTAGRSRSRRRVERAQARRRPASPARRRVRPVAARQPGDAGERRVAELPAQPLPDDCGRHDAGAAHGCG